MLNAKCSPKKWEVLQGLLSKILCKSSYLVWIYKPQWQNYSQSPDPQAETSNRAKQEYRWCFLKLCNLSFHAAIQPKTQQHSTAHRTVPSKAIPSTLTWCLPFHTLWFVPEHRPHVAYFTTTRANHHLKKWLTEFPYSDVWYLNKVSFTHI